MGINGIHYIILLPSLRIFKGDCYNLETEESSRNGRHWATRSLGRTRWRCVVCKDNTVLNDGWLSKSIAHFDRSSSLFNHAGILNAISPPKPVPKRGESVVRSPDLAYYEIWGQSLSSKRHIEKLFQAIWPNFEIRNWLHCQEVVILSFTN